MKKIFSIIQFALLIPIITLTILVNDIFQNHFIVISIILLLILFEIILNLASYYPTKKIFRFFYDYKFVGIYTAKMHYETYSYKKKFNCSKNVEWNIYFDDNTLIVEQKTDQAKSYGKFMCKRKVEGEIIYYFHYDVSPKQQNNKNVPLHKGIFMLHIKNSQISDASYIVSKPGTGNYTNIYRKK